MYVGGHFGGTNSFGGQERYKLAAVRTTTGVVDPFDPRVNTALGVFEVRAYAGDIYIGGDFTTVSGASQPHFARLPDEPPLNCFRDTSAGGQGRFRPGGYS